MKFLRRRSGQGGVEWMTVGAIVVIVLIVVVIAIVTTTAGKGEEANDIVNGIGS